MKNALLTIPASVNKNTRTTLFVRLFCDIYAHFYSLPSLEICFPFCHFTTKLSCKDNQHFFSHFKIGCISPLRIQINELRRNGSSNHWRRFILDYVFWTISSKYMLSHWSMYYTLCILNHVFWANWNHIFWTAQFVECFLHQSIFWILD